MKDDFPKYLSFVYPEVLPDGSACWVAEHPELPGCVTWAADSAGAQRALGEMAKAYLEHLRATGQPIPKPRQAPVNLTILMGGDGAPMAAQVPPTTRLAYA